MSPRISLIVAGIYGLMAVGLGAFGAHSLRERLGEALPTWNTGAHYQLVHAGVLLALGLLGGDSPWLRRSALAFAFGGFIFPASLYGVALGMKVLGAVAPVGGLGLLVGWACIFAYGVSERR